MFNNKSKTTENTFITGVATIVAQGTEIIGNITSKGDIRVDGTLTGNLTTSSKVLVGPSGKILGDVNALQADVLGEINGTIKVVELLYIKGNSKIIGNIYAGQLQVDATASFNGECHMGGSETESNAPLANVGGTAKEKTNVAAKS